MTHSITELTPESVYKWTHIVLKALRATMLENDFNEIIPAIISERYEPGASHSVAVLGNKKLPTITINDANHFDEQVTVSGRDYYYLPVSHVVEKQMSLEYLDKVYCLAPCLRLVMDGEEISGKHLYNFFQFEIEWRTESMEDVFQQGESILVNAATQILEQMEQHQLKFINNGDRNLKSVMKGNFPIITFKEALKMLNKPAGFEGDLSQQDDKDLTNMFDRPFWIYDYPDGVRDSIYHKNSKGTFDTYDLMLPFGYGELTTGGIRPKSGKEIIEQSVKLGKQYSPLYAEWKDQSQIQTAGFGIGLERFLRFLSGAESILDFVQYHDNGPNQRLKKLFANTVTETHLPSTVTT